LPRSSDLTPPASGTFSIVFICTGNRFRSVLAEAFVGRLTAGLPVSSESFGTLDLGGAPPLREAVKLGRAHGVDVSGHTTRCVSGASLAETDLVVGFEAAHLRQAVVDASAERLRSFTMREVVRLLEEAPPPQDEDVVAGARRAVAAAAASRGSDPVPRLADRTPDPLGSSAKVYRETAGEVRDLSLRLVAQLFGITDAGGLPEPEPTTRLARLWRR
jgi:protein-tyrosine-phosphatase